MRAQLTVKANGPGTPARAAAVVAGAALAASLAGCTGGGDAAAGYFPLAEGHRWTYAVTTEREGRDAVERETLVMTTEGPEVLDSGPAWRRRSASGVDYWLRADASGVFRVASKTDLQAEPVPDKAPRYVLKAPFTPGTEWQASTTAYLLERKAEFPREIRHTHEPVVMGYAIEAVGETITTRAGAFADCIRVKGRARMRLYADPVVGWRDLPLVTTEWYCQGVGLAKLVREEAASSTFLSGGTLTMELVSWK